MSRSLGLSVIAVALLALPTPALTCSIIARDRTPYELQTLARDRIEGAAAIIDGEVVRPLSETEPALVRAERVLRGPNQPFFAVGERTSCDIALLRTGERLRMILHGGPDVYFLSIDASDAAYEDRILGSDRETDWPYFPGSP